MASPQNASRPLPEEVRHVHLTAVCGVGMAALAGMLQERGHTVTGSDENVYPPMSVLLERLGIAVRQGYRAENIADPPDLVVIGNRVSRDNAEVRAILESGIPYLSFPEALGSFFLAGRTSVVVAGTHGKTTSTALLAWILEHAGLDPSMMVGGHSLDFDGNYKLGNGSHFVVEGDEYDSAFFDKGPKFLHYHPNAVLLNAVEFDHADIYADLRAVQRAFHRLVDLLDERAPLVVCADFPHAREVIADARARVSTFGCAEGAQWAIADLHERGGMTRFTACFGGRAERALALHPPGRMNARNALGCYVLARELGVGGAVAAEAISLFRGVARRQEWVGTPGGVLLIDDFAHHPTAVELTLEALRARFPERRLWGVFEPRSNTSRRKIFQKDYAQALARADRVVIAGVFHKETDRLGGTEELSTGQLVAALDRSGRRAWALDGSEAIVAHLVREAEPGDVVVMMSNGDFGGLRRRLVEALEARG